MRNGMQAAVLTATFCALATGATAASPLGEPDDRLHILVSDVVTGETRIDPGAFFHDLVNRYRNIKTYADVADVVQVTRRDGAEPREVRTRVQSTIVDGRLRVRTPGSTWRRTLHTMPFRTSPVHNRAADAYALWLAPHMSLKYADPKKHEFRAGVPEGFTATEAERVHVGDKPMVQIGLKSGDGTSGDCLATIELLVNPESMLVERIQGAQRMPDGATFETTLTIHPDLAVVDADVIDDAPATAAPDGLLPPTITPPGP